jgi:hypothetical protein
MGGFNQSKFFAIPAAATFALMLAGDYGFTLPRPSTVSESRNWEDNQKNSEPDRILLRIQSIPLQQRPRGETSWFNSTTYSRGGRIVATAGVNSAISLWDAHTGKQIHQLEARPNGTVSQLAYSPDEQLLATAGQDKLVHLFDTATGKEVGALHGCTAWITCVAFSADGKLLATGDKDKVIRIWDVAQRKELFALRGCADELLNVSFSPDGTLLASTSQEGRIRIWDLAKKDDIRAWDTNRRGCVAFSPVSNTVAMTDKDGGIVWLKHARTGEVIWRLGDRRFWNESLAFSSDGRFLAGGGAGVVSLWEVSTGKMALQIFYEKGHIFHCNNLAFSPDGRQLAGATTDGGKTMLVWDLTGWGGHEPPRGAALTDDQLSSVWSQLLSEDCAKAHHAIWSLVAAGKKTPSLVQSRLLPGEEESREAKRWLKQLGDDQFAVRQKATKELEKLAESAAPAVRRELVDNTSAEARRRLERVLKVIDDPARRRHLDRAIAVLEYLNTPESKEVLKNLAAESNDDQIKAEAKASFERLAKRNAKD